MATRVVTGPIVDAEGAPWPGFELAFRVLPATYTTTATVPYADVTVTTDEAGDFAVTLITGITYEVRLETAFVRHSSANVSYPRGTIFNVVVPEGEGPITLAELQALGNVPVTPPQAASIIAAWLAEHSAELEALVAPTLAVGTVEDGETAAAAITGSAGAYSLDLTLPRGEPGADSTVPGPPNSLSIGTVTEGPANATITGDAPSQTLNLVLPKGEDGTNGAGVPTGGATGQVLVKTGAGDYATGWAAPPMILPQSGVWLTPETQGMGSSNLSATRAAVAGSMDMAPLYFPIPLTLYRIGISVAVASGSGSCRLGLYDSSGNLLVDAGSLGTTAIGDVAITFASDIAVTPGWHYAVLLPDASFTWRGYLPLQYTGASNLSFTSVRQGWSRQSVPYGPLPATISTALTNSGEGPRIGVVAR